MDSSADPSQNRARGLEPSTCEPCYTSSTLLAEANRIPEYVAQCIRYELLSHCTANKLLGFPCPSAVACPRKPHASPGGTMGCRHRKAFSNPSWSTLFNIQEYDLSIPSPIMSQQLAYTGPWVDCTRNLALGATLTLKSSHGAYLIAFLTALVTIAGASAWTLLAFTLHQVRATNETHDAVFYQHQVVLRNAGSAPASVWTLFKTARA